MKALLVVRTASCQQESYETASRSAAKRSRQLRKLGYQVTTSPMGLQVTPWGFVKLTMVTIFNPDDNLPKVEEYQSG